MATKDVAITKLNTIYNDLNASDRMTTVLRDTSLGLLSILVADQDIPVDTDIIRSFEKINTRLGAMGAELTTEVGLINTELALPQFGPPVPNNLVTRWRELNNEKNRLDTAIANLPTRRAYYSTLYTEANNLETTPTLLTPLNVDITTPVPRAATPTTTRNTNTHFVPAIIPAHRSYELIAKTGETLRRDGTNYKYTRNGVEYTLSGMAFNRTTGVLDITNLQITPAGSIDFDALEFSVRGMTEEHTIRLQKDKTLKINLAGVIVNLDQGARTTELTNFNTAGAGVIATQLTTTYNRDHEEDERETLLEVLKDNNDPRRTEVMASEDKKEALFRFLLPLYSTTGWGGNVHTPATFTTFKDFTQWFACDDREWNKDINNTKNGPAYNAYIARSYPDQVKAYIRNQFRVIFSNPAAYQHLKANLLRFWDQYDNRERDNNSHVHLDTSLPAKPAKHRDKHLLGIIPFGKARSYVSLFTGAETSIKNQKLSLRDEHNKPEEIAYDMDFKVHSANKMLVKITKKDPNTGEVKEIMEKSGGDPTSLIRKVIRGLPRLKGKERMHIAYNIMRSMIEIAKSKKIPLSYITGNQTRTLSVADNGNILLESDTVDTTTHRSDIQKVFDYNQHFAATQNRDCGGTSLESGIVGIMRHFNQAMEHTYQNYRDVISNKLFGAPDKLNTKINARRYQPFKLLNNLRNKRKFSYDIPSTQVGNAQVTISFKENNAFEITLQRYGKTYTFKGANLKNILKAKRGGKKVFEGIGNEVLALIHNQHFTALRENTKMLQENQLFAAKDPKTGRWYFMDDEGRLSYMAHWDNASLKAIQSEITTAANRKKGRHIAGAVGATAGAGWLGTGAGLSVAGIAKGVGAAGAGAIGGHKLFTKIFHKNEENYGVIHNADNIDLGRTYLSTEEQDQLLYSNPVLIGRLRKAMKNRMGIFESGRAALAKMRA